MIPFIYFTNLCNLSGSLGFLLLARGKLDRPPRRQEAGSLRISSIGFVVAKNFFHSSPASDVVTSCNLLLCVQME